MTRLTCILFLALLSFSSAFADSEHLRARVESHSAEFMEQVVQWRRDFHENPELGNREFRTAGIIAEHLRQLGMEVRTEVGHTGVVGVLRGAHPGPVVALRADMDGLPVTETGDLPFASKIRSTYNGQEVGVMHACGHDNHMAILMGAASVLNAMKDDLPGTVKFIFQPAEEGAPEGEEGGAELMLREGAFEDPRPEVAFALHVFPYPSGQITYRTGGMLAAADPLNITVRGKQTHAAWPWDGVDPIVTASQIILGLQTVISRQMDLTEAPAVVSIGMIQGGVRRNIIPDEVELRGTIRTLSPTMREQVHERVRRTAISIAEANGATAEVEIDLGYPVTMNDPELTSAMVPTLEWAAHEGEAIVAPPVMGAEDFSLFAEECPGLYIGLGVTPRDQDPADVAANHSPQFFADESALPVGVKAMAGLAVDYMSLHRKK